MKKLCFSAFLVVTLAWLAPVAPAQPLAGYTNSTTVTTPILIDATNFVNLGTFEFATLSTSPYSFLDVLMFTNRGVMWSEDTGILFDHEVQNQYGAVTHSLANIFGNANQGQIYGGELGQTPAIFIEELDEELLFAPPVITISATNVVNRGLIDTDVSGVIDISGTTVDLSRGTLHVEGYDSVPGTDLLATSNIANIGIHTELYGLSKQSNLLSLVNFTLVPPLDPTSPLCNATNVTGLAVVGFTVAPPTATAFPLEFAINGSNMAHQVVFINTNLPGISTSVGFLTGGGSVGGGGGGGGLAAPVIQWQAVVTNISGELITNSLYLEDTFGSMSTNFNLVTNSYTFSGYPELAPYNYTFTQTFPGFNSLTHANSGYNPTNVFAGAFNTTNQYSVYEVDVEPVAFAPDPTALASSLTNLPGRIVLTASGNGSSLDLTRSTITGANYLSINATNQWLGSAGADIVVPNMDINLGSSNGFLAVSNLVAPTIPRTTGLISMYSARWTQVDTNMMTNTYCVLFVSASLAPSTPVLVQDLLLSSTNVVLNDLLEVNSNLLINAQNLTLGTNPVTSQIPSGTLISLNPDISWPASAPFLRNFTNLGILEITPILNFQDQSGAPYNSFVNQGEIFGDGISVLANYFEDSTFNGLLESFGGPISITASNAVLSSGEIFSPADLTLAVGSLGATNFALQASGVLNLSISNTLSDGGAFSGDFWTAGDGMSLLQKPATGDFLGTTFTLTAPAGQEVNVTWAGLDEGVSAAGFKNNGAVGLLILSGGDTNSDFAFGGLNNATNYAIYVDQIQLENGATNRADVDGSPNFTAFNVASNMKVYFADAVIGSLDISEKLNGANNGQLVWVPSYAGIFSGITVNADNAGHTIYANRALAQSDDIDSNYNGIFNAFDSVPFFTSYQLNFGVGITNLPPKAPVLTWSTIPNSTNILYASTNLAGTNWLVLTNFVATNGNPGFNATTRIARVVDQVRTNGAFYKVQVNAAQP